MPKQIEKLIAGFQEFRKQYFEKNTSLYKQLVTNGQKPNFLVIACSDSRVDPAILLNTKPGDLFVVRNVANLVPPYEQDGHYHGTSAALEFSVCDLGIQHIILLGHSQCGGIRALMQEDEIAMSHTFIEHWMHIASQAKEKTLAHCAHESFDVKVEQCCRYSLRNSLHNLMTFPFVKQRVAQGKLFLHAWYFDFQNGKLFAEDLQSEEFFELA